MPHVQWNSSMSVNVPLFDQHHQKLFSIFNELTDHMEQGKGKEIIFKTLEDLCQYTQYHFSEEEKFMLRSKYSDYSHHKREHDVFIGKVNTAVQKCKDNHSTSAMIELSGFLKSWLLEHILKVDRKYGNTQ